MADVTVLGAGGSTVTVPFISAANASAAQSALNIINLAVSVGLMNQVNYTGSGTIPAPSGAPLTGMIATGSVTGNAGALPFGAIDFVTNSTGKVTVVGPTHVITVASGIGGMVFGNQSSGAKVFIGQGNSTYIGFNGAQAEIAVDGTGNTIWDFGSKTATTVKGYDGSATSIIRGLADTLGGINGGTGAISVMAQAGTSTYVQLLQGAATSTGGPAMTISGAAGANISYEGREGTSAFINPTSGNVTIQAPTIGGSGAVTLAGGSAAASFTGSATVFGGVGLFQGGKAGNNLLQTSTVAGVTTLVGSGNGDQLFNYAAKNVLIAGAGSQTLVGATAATVGGAIFQTGGGNATVFGNAGGGNSFFLGNGISNITGANNGAALHATANFYSTIAPGGTALISDFISGLDKFSISLSSGAPSVSTLDYFTANQSGSPFGSFYGTQVVLSDKTTIYFYQSNVTKADFS